MRGRWTNEAGLPETWPVNHGNRMANQIAKRYAGNTRKPEHKILPALCPRRRQPNKMPSGMERRNRF